MHQKKKIRQLINQKQTKKYQTKLYEIKCFWLSNVYHCILCLSFPSIALQRLSIIGNLLPVRCTYVVCHIRWQMMFQFDINCWRWGNASQFVISKYIVHRRMMRWLRAKMRDKQNTKLIILAAALLVLIVSCSVAFAR